MADPIVYGADYSTYVRSVRLALEEKGIAYRLERVDIMSGEAQSAEHLRRQPFGKIPAFEHDGFSLFETVAINRYIDEAFPGPALQPRDVRQRARMTQVMAIIDGYGYKSMISDIVIQRLVVPLMGGTADETVIEAALPQAKRTFAVLESLIGEQPYFAGDAVSLADLHLTPIYDYMAQTPEGAAMLAESPALERWWQAMGGRDSVVRTRPALG